MTKIHLSSQQHERQVYPIEYFPASVAYAAVKGSKARLEISCHPL